MKILRGNMASAGSPLSRALAPLPLPLSSITTNAPHIASSSASPTSAQSLTAKKWVVPPRPKPGRKPATDTPPTKRKAQNRAAQRAFRERRAAKVGELEEQMEELEHEHEAVVEGLRADIAELESRFDQQLRDRVGAYETEVRSLESEIGAWRERCHELGSLLDEERRRREGIERELAVAKGEAVRLPSRLVRSGEASNLKSNDSNDAQQAYQTPEELTDGCWRCSSGARCQCIEEAFNIEASTEETESSKRPSSPSTQTSDSNKRTKIKLDDSTDELEIDFTTRPTLPSFSSGLTNGSLTSTVAIPLSESCGFCQDGSACLCAELAAEQQVSKESEARLLSPPRELSKPQCTANNSCSKASCLTAPGTCVQCRSNPESTLFCKSLAARRASQIPSRPITSLVTATQLEPCAAGAACCRISSTLANLPPIKDTPSYRSSNGPTISCADAFTTLSRHPAYERATKDLDEWLPRLTTLPGQSHAHPASALLRTGRTAVEVAIEPEPEILAGTGELKADDQKGRTAFEIEAASVMGVLRFFDRRFGRDG